jgi:ubiquinol-cytochrome c reductase iron-sulfur subunit|tara:strand:+ start:1114 stop:1722 length:609 start_codon:yes stop_codon:yes gene_type:complete
MGDDWMSNDGVNNGRRRFLVAATGVVGAAGAVGVAVPFVGSWFPSARAKAAGAPVRVNISKLEAGQQIVAEWRGQPVFISRRTPEALEILEENVGILADPESESSSQPEYVDLHTRAIRPEVLVVMGICTHLGCSPLFRPEVASADMGNEWKGGYFCPCHSSRYDMAGRVHRGQPAPLNLPVPPHSYETDDIIVVGLDEESA